MGVDALVVIALVVGFMIGVVLSLFLFVYIRYLLHKLSVQLRHDIGRDVSRIGDRMYDMKSAQSAAHNDLYIAMREVGEGLKAINNRLDNVDANPDNTYENPTP